MYLKTMMLVFVISITATFFASSNHVYATETPSVPTITVNSSSTYAGNSTYLSIQIDQAVNLAALSFEIYFDPEIISIYSASAGYVISSENTVLNYDTSGVFIFSMISLDGINGSGTIANLWVSVASDAALDDYPLTLVIGEAHDTSLNPLEIHGQSGKISVLEQDTSFESISMYSYSSQYSLKQSDTFDITLYAWDLKNLASGNFEIYYDASKFDFIELNLGSVFSDIQAIHSLNDQNEGYLNLSFAAIQGMTSAYPIMTISFRVISNVDASSQLIIKPKNLYNVELEPLLSYETSIALSLYKIIPEDDHPNVWISNYTGSNKESFDVEVSIETNSLLAAGDFTIQYDSNEIKATQIRLGGYVESNGGFLIYNETIDQGLIKFSYINENGLDVQEVLLIITFTPLVETSYQGSISISGVGVVDSQFEPVEFDYLSATINLSRAYTIIFKDNTGNIIQESLLYENDPIVAPAPPLKLGYEFQGWDKTFNLANGDMIITAIYTPTENVQFGSESFTYDGTNHSISVLNVPEGASVIYSPSNQAMIPGVYPIEARIVKEGYEDLVLNATMTIEKAEITLQAENKSSIFGQELVELTYIVMGQLYDELVVILTKEEGLAAGTYNISIEAEHPYYIITLVNGSYSIIGQNIDMSGITFNNQTYTYDGTEKAIYILGDLPTGIISVEYSNNTLTDAGTIQASAHFVVEEGVNPVDNLIATLTVEKAVIEGIEIQGGTFTYDGVVKSFTLNKTTTQYGDEVSVVFDKENAFTDAGTHIIHVTLSHPNYDELVLEQSLIIEKASLEVNIDLFTLDVRATSVTVHHQDFDEYIILSINGIDFVDSNQLSDLQDETEYQLIIIISESMNYLESNALTINITTYRSSDDLMALLNDETVNLMDLYDNLVLVYNEMSKVHPDDLISIQTLFDEKTSDYNAYVTSVNSEYDTTKQTIRELIPIIILSGVGLLPVVLMKRGSEWR